MPRRKPDLGGVRSARLGREVDWKRGRHSKSTSAEVKRWEAELLIPEPPGWMDAETYAKLAALRNAL